MNENLQIKLIYPLSPMQAGMYFHYSLRDKNFDAYFTQTVFSIKGNLDLSLFDKSFNQLIDRYDILRTIFVIEGLDEPLQVVLKERTLNIHFEDISSLSKDGQDAYFEEFKIKDRQKRFDLARDLLLRISIFKVEENSYLLLWSSHHILMDGWCMGIVYKNLIRIYESQLKKKSLQLEPIIPYKKYIDWLQYQDKEEGLKFWEEYLEGYDQQITLSKSAGDAKEEKYMFEKYIANLNQSAAHGLRKLAAENQVTPAIVFQTLWGILLHRYNNTDDVVFGTVVSGRPSEIEDIEHIVGLFINTVPLRITTTSEQLFSQLLGEVCRRTILSKPYEYLPLAEVQTKSVLKENLIDHILIFENYPLQEELNIIGSEEELGLKIEYIDDYLPTNYDFNMTVIPADGLRIEFKFNSLVYSVEFIKNLTLHLKRVIEQILKNPDLKLVDIDMVSEEHRREILSQLNANIEIQLGAFQDRLFNSLEKFKDRTAVEYGEETLSYSRLKQMANLIAAWIITNGIKENSFIGIYNNDKMNYVAAIIGILEAKCVFVPLDTVLPIKRIKNMIQSTHTKILFIEDENKQQILNSIEPMDDDIKTVSINNQFFERVEPLISPKKEMQYSPEDWIYIYFTSGTTRQPKGILGKNKGLLHFINWEIETFHIDEKFRVSQFINPGFDAFLRDIFVTLCAGGTICIPGSKDTMMCSDELITWIDQRQINLIHCVPAMFRLFNTGDLTPENFKRLKYILLSGERISPGQLKPWYQKFGERIQLVNLYGTSETTMAKTYYFIRKSDLNRKKIPIGKPIKGAQIILLDKNLNICPKGSVGEIYIRTPYRTSGYHNDPQLNRERFIRNPFSNGPQHFLHKTGDFGLLLPDGNYELLNRIDRQVKVRGVRVELEEIENHLLDHQRIKETVVLPTLCTRGNRYEPQKGEDDDNELCAYIVSDDHLNVSELRQYMAGLLPEYMIPSYFVFLDKIPLTTNGKVDTKALPKPGIQNAAETYQAPRDELEKKLIEIWSEILAIETGLISINSNFFEIGGHSLKATIMASKIHKELNVKLPLSEIYKTPIIKALAESIKTKKVEKDNFSPVQPVEKKEYYSLSSAQKRLYIVCQMDRNNIIYNMPAVLVQEGECDWGRMEKSFRVLVERHESLRTSFEPVNGEPVQRIHEEVDFSIEYHDLGTANKQWEVEEIETVGQKTQDRIIQSFVRPFDLSRAPLLRIDLIKMHENNYILMVDMHHIISDGNSIQVFVKEFTTLYMDKKPEPLRVQYKDYSEWQNCEAQKEVIKSQEVHWLKEFKQNPPLLNLPIDYTRPKIQNFEGSQLDFKLEGEELDTLKKYAHQEEATLFMVLLAVYYIFLAKISQQEDIVVGVVVAGRRHADLEQIIGVFVNMLALRNFPQKEKTFKAFLAEVRYRTITSFDNQDYQFDQLVEKVVKNRDLDRQALVNVGFGLGRIEEQQLDTSSPELADLKFTTYGYERKVARNDLNLLGYGNGQTVHFTWEYSNKLFKKETIKKFVLYYRNIISSVIKNPGQRIEEIEITSQEEKDKVRVQIKAFKESIQAEFDL